MNIRNSGRGFALLAGIAPALFLGGLVGGCGSSGASSSGNGGASIATVGGQAISRDELRDYLEAAYGANSLGQLIDYQLVLQALKAKGLDVTDAEVTKALQDQLETTKKQEGSAPPTPGTPRPSEELQKVLSAPGARQETLKRVTRYRLALDKLLTADVKVDEAGLKKWFEANRARYDKPASLDIGILATSQKARADLMSRQLASKTKTFQELVGEQAKANDPLGRNSTASVPVPATGLATIFRNPAIGAKIEKLQVNQVMPPQSVATGPGGPPAFLIVRMNKREAAVKADYTKLHDRIEQDYKFDQVDRQAATLDPQQPPRQAALNKLLTGLRSGAKLEINDPTYSSIADAYKVAPASASGAVPGGAMLAPGAPAPAAPNRAPAGGNAAR